MKWNHLLKNTLCWCDGVRAYRFEKSEIILKQMALMCYNIGMNILVRKWSDD